MSWFASPGRTLPIASLLLSFLVLAAGSLGSVPAFAGSSIPSAEVRGTITTMDGDPIEGAAVDFTESGVAAKPFTVKTRKDGQFVFPFLPYAKNRYEMAVRKDGFKVKHIKVLSRAPQSTADKGDGMVFQDDNTPDALDQKLPPVIAKPGGHITIEVQMISDEVYNQMVAAKAAAEKAKAVAAGEAPPAPEAPKDPIEQARVMAAGGDYEAATEAITKAITEEPSAEKYYVLATIRQQADDAPGAKRALAKATGIDPGFKDAHFLLGKLLSDDGQTDEAIAEEEKALAADPDDPNVKRFLAALYAGANRRDDAIRIYENLTSGTDPDPEMLARLAGLYTAKGEIQKANEISDRIVAIDPAKADQLYLKIGLAIVNQANFGDEDRKRAAEAFRKCIEVNPKNARAHKELGLVLIGLNQLAEAKTHLQKFVELAPADKEAGSIRSMIKEL